MDRLQELKAFDSQRQDLHRAISRLLAQLKDAKAKAKYTSEYGKLTSEYDLSYKKACECLRK